jgi:hypothetical protein
MAIWDVLDVFGESILGPVVVGGVVVSMIASPELRKRARKLGVQGIAAVMAASEFANRELRGATNGTGGMASQISNRVRQAAAEVREEWQDFIAEARSAQHKLMESPPAKTSSAPVDRAQMGSSNSKAPRRTTRRRPSARPRRTKQT